MKELPRVASNFYQFCKKCDAERYHRVLTHTSSTSAKIECEVCSSKKTFKISEGSTVAKKAGTRAKRKPKEKGNPQYNEMKEKLAEAKAAPYRMSESYEVNHVIEHPKFGTGFIFATSPDKIDVAFPDVNRSFVQNRK